MRKYSFLPFLLFPLMVLLLASCSDENNPSSPGGNEGDRVRVRLNIGIERAVASGTTRASWSDGEAADGEMMKSWVVVAVKSDGTIDRVLESSTMPEGDSERENDYAWTDLTADADGTKHTFYAFANIPKADISKAMGLGSADELKEGATVDVSGDANWTYNVDGNQSSVKAFPNGIPMSNKQEVQVVKGQTVDLWVVRMVAKVEVKIKNTSDSAILVPYFVMHNLTAYKSGQDNLKLLPGALPSGSSKRSLNLNGKPDKVKQEYEFLGKVFMYYDDSEVPAGGTKTFTAYVNESQAAPDGYFNFELYTGNESDKYSAKNRSFFAFADDNESDRLWKTIARNELHVLNITLDRFNVRIDVTAFTAIAVAPSVHDDDTLAVINLGMYGEFHLTPVIVDRRWGVIASNTRLTNPQIALDASTNTFGEGHAPFIWWNTIANPQLFGLSVGNYGGEAVYTFTGTIDNKYQVRKRIKIINTKINFNDLAKEQRFFSAGRNRR